jgi:hypothetical protein
MMMRRKREGGQRCEGKAEGGVGEVVAASGGVR